MDDLALQDRILSFTGNSGAVVTAAAECRQETHLSCLVEQPQRTERYDHADNAYRCILCLVVQQGVNDAF